MCTTLIHRFSTGGRRAGGPAFGLFDWTWIVWVGQVHLFDMDRNQLSALGLEQMLTTRELADYLGVKVQAIYDLRSEGRAPVAIPVGGGLRFRASDVRAWLDRRRESGMVAAQDGEL